MATSQFKLYTNYDVGAPILNGLSGSLINVLNWCLVSGSGWLQPSASINYNGSSVPTVGIYQQPSGSKCVLYVNDTGPNITSLGQEAWVTGFESLTTMSVPCGTGSVQFPWPSQLLTTGHFVVRKSSTATFAKRDWIMYADPYTFYFFNLSENTSTYASLFFGDFYTLNSTLDPKHCFLSARTIENTAATATGDQNDMISFPQMLNGNVVATNGHSGVTPRYSGNLRNSSWIFKMGDLTKANSSYYVTSYYPMLGVIPFPNQMDNAMYVCPLTVWQGCAAYPSAGMIRGRMRGMYHIPHPITSFSDGQVVSGSVEYANKVFQIVKQGANGGFWGIEISPTLETN